MAAPVLSGAVAPARATGPPRAARPRPRAPRDRRPAFTLGSSSRSSRRLRRSPCVARPREPRQTRLRRAGVVRCDARLDVAAMVSAVWMWSPQVIANRQAFAFPEEALDQHSARWWSYLLPPAGHPWFGHASAAIWRSAWIDTGLLEQQLSLGISVIALAAVPSSPPARHSRRPSRAASPECYWRRPSSRALCSLPPACTSDRCRCPCPRASCTRSRPCSARTRGLAWWSALMITTLAGADSRMLLARRSPARARLPPAWSRWPCSSTFPHCRRHAMFCRRRRTDGSRTTPPHRLLDCATPTPGAGAGLAWLMRGQVAFRRSRSAIAPIRNWDRSSPRLDSPTCWSDTTRRARLWLASGGRIADVQPVRIEHDASVYEVVARQAAALHDGDDRLLSTRVPWRRFVALDGTDGTMAIVNVTQTLLGSLELELEAFARSAGCRHRRRPVRR